MKKNFAILLALVMVLTIGLSVLSACEDPSEKTVVSIEVVGAKTAYKVGDSIDYDNLQIKVTYDDKSTVTKTVKELNATVVKADLSKAGNTSYTVTYSGKPVTVTLTVTAEEPTGEVKNFQAVTFVEPTFYTNYKIKSADRGAKEETRADFRVTGETYEVGNVNKFVYRPSATGLDLEQRKTVTLTNVKTTAKVYSKDTKAGTYAEVTGSDLAEFVAIDDNTYKFTEQAAGKFVKLEISLDAEKYDVEGLEEENRTLEVEFVVVDGGYNVYNQLGLSVMCDIGRNAWADLWGCKSTWDAEKGDYVLSDKAGTTALKLEADDQPLYKYVNNVSWVILHNSIELNADQMPARYFWNSESDEGYTAAYTSLAGLPEMQKKLIGSLNDGMNNEFYYRILDMVPSVDAEGNVTNLWADSFAVGLGEAFGPNMQKGLFLTKKVSVSGNYNSITVPTEASAGGRTFHTIADWDADSGDGDALIAKRANPVTHYSIFQMYMPGTEEGYNTHYIIKNISMSGNSTKQDLSSEELAKGVPAGMMMSLNYARHMEYNNVVADKFFTNVIVDGYGETGVDIINTKFYDSYSNMSYMWRSKVNVVNSEMIGSGGPLFILCDGDNHFTNSEGLTDANGSALVVDKESVLKAYAVGNESWYSINSASPIVNKFKSDLEPGMNALGKTIFTTQNGLDYINIIAVIICSPGKLFNPINNNDGSMMDVYGSYTVKGEENDVTFAMHNQMLKTLREASKLGDGAYDARRFPVILQLGSKVAYNKGDGKMYTLDGMSEKELTQQEYGEWMMDTTNNTLGVYMSAAPVTGQRLAPYFCAIVEINQKAA